MPKLPRISSREAIRALERLGFEQVRQTGSHVVVKKQTDADALGCVVPMHKELKAGTLSGILKQAQVTRRSPELTQPPQPFDRYNRNR